MKTKLTLLISVMLLSMLPASLSAQTVYLAEANRNPFKRTIFLSEQGETFRYTACYKGPLAPQGDIAVTFSVDAAKADAYNTKHGTSYQILPKGSYTIGMDSAVIPKGTVSAAPGYITVKGKGHLKASEKYIRPVTMSVKGNLAKAEPELSTVYYLITIVTAPGDFPHREVAPDMVNNIFFSFNDKCLLALTPSGDLLRYGWNETAKKFDAPTTVQTGWNEIKEMAQGANNTVQVFYKDGSIVTYQFNEDATSAPLKTGTIFTAQNTGVNNFILVGNGKHSRMLLIQVNNGYLMNYGLNATWTEHTGLMVQTPFDCRIYKTLFFYNQDAVGITESGDLWIHKFSPSDFSFSTSPAKISSGWKDFTHITAFGNNLLARDASGKLWLYEFRE